MKIKYTSCDNETVVEEEIVSAEFYWGRHREEVECIRSDKSEFLWCGNIFVVPCKRIDYIKN